MHYHTGNVYCYVVPNVNVLIFLTKKQIINIPTLVLQFDFKFIILFRVVEHMEGFHETIRKFVACVNIILLQKNPQNKVDVAKCAASV